MAPFLRGLAALFLALGEPLLPFDPLLESTLAALLLTVALMLLPLLVGSERIHPRIRSLLPLAGFGLSLAVAGWAALVERTAISRAPLLGAALLFGPYFVAEAAYALAEFRLVPEAWRKKREGEALHFARGVLLGSALPIVPFVAFSLYVQLLHVFTGAVYWVELFPSLSVPLAASFLVLGFGAAPFVVAPVLGARPLEEGPLRERLLGLARAIAFEPREIYRWNAAGGVANGFVLGLVPRLRPVFLSEGLLEALGPDEVAAVFAHEAGHAKRGHFLLYGGLAAAFLLLFAGLENVFLEAGAERLGEGGSLWVSLAFVAVFWGLLFPFLSRRLERDADLFGATREAAMPWALLRVAAANRIDLSRSGWRHYSVKRRLEDLKGLGGGGERKHRREIVLLRVLVALLLALGMGVFLRGVPAEWLAGRGRAALDAGDARGAAELLREAIDGRPNDALARFDLGRALLRSDRPLEGLVTIGDALRRTSGSPALYGFVAREFWRLGGISAAAQAAETYRLGSLASRGDRRELASLLTALRAEIVRLREA